MENLDAVKRRLQKLMRLYEGAKNINSEGEANNAAAAIQNILLQYNLSMSDISGDFEEEGDSVKENVMSCYRYKSIGGDWEFKLMYVVCKWNFCKVFKYGKISEKRMIFFGKKENMETVKWLYDMLCERFIYFGKQRFKEHKNTEEYRINPIGLDTYLRRYLEGCARGLDCKFQEESDLKKSENSQDFGNKVTALVVRNNQAIDTYVKNKFGGYSKRRATHRTKRDSCFMSGFSDGRKTEIYKQVSGTSSESKMLK